MGRHGTSPGDMDIETIGSVLGRVAAQVDRWKKERTEIAGQLRSLLAEGKRMLVDLGHEESEAAPRARTGGRPRGYKTSAETKAKLRAAWARRKARMGPAAGQTLQKDRTLSADARARIAAAQKKGWAKVKRA